MNNFFRGNIIGKVLLRVVSVVNAINSGAVISKRKIPNIKGS